jgi:hypothetical protein
MLHKLDFAKHENAKMAGVVRSFSQRVQGEEASRKIIAVQAAAQESAISSMHVQRAALVCLSVCPYVCLGVFKEKSSL